MQEEKYVYGGSTESADGEWIFHVDVDNIRGFLRISSLDDYRRIVTELDAQFTDERAPSTTRTAGEVGDNPNRLQRCLLSTPRASTD